MALGGSDAKLVFRKRVYKHVHDIPNDPVEYHLLYAEAVHKVVKVSVNHNRGLENCFRLSSYYWTRTGVFMNIF